MLSIVLAYQPYFINQPQDITVFWGYGLSPERVGNYIKKKMSDCSGEEIMVELISHLHMENQQENILHQANCIPCMLPYITAQFLTRSKGDWPNLLPKGYSNFAFLGQFAELPDDVVFTVKYSVRTAQIAVYNLLRMDKRVPAIYKGPHDINIPCHANKALYQEPT